MGIGSPGRTNESQHVDQLLAWREARLRLAGFDTTEASRLASEDIDLHALFDLIDRGCPFDLAARILAPLPDERGGR